MEMIRSQIDRPDFVLLTGDLSQDGSTASYEALSTMLTPLETPLYWLPGNHDSLETMLVALDQKPFHQDKDFQRGNWRFLLLNSQIPGQVPGHLSAAVLDRLAEALAQQPDVPTTIAFHHPPLTLATTWLNQSALQNPDELFAILDRFPQVKLVLFGHIHQAIARERKGVTYLGTPSTCIQFATQGNNFALDEGQHPGFRELLLYPDGTWQTTVHRVNVHLTPDLTSTGY